MFLKALCKVSEPGFIQCSSDLQRQRVLKNNLVVGKSGVCTSDRSLIEFAELKFVNY